MGQVITANRLRDGVVVFRAADGSWPEHIEAAEVHTSPESVKTALAASVAAEADNHVLDVYAIDVAAKEGGLVPTRLREAIRATGPTTHPEHGKSRIPRPNP